jgi:hypothetical protein
MSRASMDVAPGVWRELAELEESELPPELGLGART